jgi:hypothetical protein
MVREMGLYRNIGALIGEIEEMREELLGEEPSKEREIEVALFAHIQFTQRAFLELAREVDALRTKIEGQGDGSQA